MATLALAPKLACVPLREIRGTLLDPILEEESAAWMDALGWDFGPTASLVRHFADARALDGFALLDGSRAAGYLYSVREGPKVLLGNLFVGGAWAGPDAEALLIEAALGAARRDGVRRVEAQLMVMRHRLQGRAAGRQFARHVMVAPAGPRIAARNATADCLPWSPSWHDASARLLHQAYQQHVDADINDQYRSESGCWRFLWSMVQNPGCGSFLASASFAAFDHETGQLCGISLASLVGPGMGHITQLCVAPWAQGRGIGSELLRHSSAALAAAGAAQVSLTVTASNRSAMKLYRSTGFRVLMDFPAYVWNW
jgi:ribosomal protein S18 acetylase RimI-like enzyme